MIFGEWIADEILEEVNHKHYVFGIPKIIRPYFKYDRKLLGKLCRCGYDTITTFYRCHVHGLFSEGAFDKEGRFYQVTGLPKKKMEEYFRLEVLSMLIGIIKLFITGPTKPHSPLNLWNFWRG